MSPALSAPSRPKLPLPSPNRCGQSHFTAFYAMLNFLALTLIVLHLQYTQGLGLWADSRLNPLIKRASSPSPTQAHSRTSATSQAMPLLHSPVILPGSASLSLITKARPTPDLGPLVPSDGDGSADTYGALSCAAGYYFSSSSRTCALCESPQTAPDCSILSNPSPFDISSKSNTRHGAWDGFSSGAKTAMVGGPMVLLAGMAVVAWKIQKRKRRPATDLHQSLKKEIGANMVIYHPHDLPPFLPSYDENPIMITPPSPTVSPPKPEPVPDCRDLPRLAVITEQPPSTWPSSTNSHKKPTALSKQLFSGIKKFGNQVSPVVPSLPGKSEKVETSNSSKEISQTETIQKPQPTGKDLPSPPALPRSQIASAVDIPRLSQDQMSAPASPSKPSAETSHGKTSNKSTAGPSILKVKTDSGPKCSSNGSTSSNTHGSVSPFKGLPPMIPVIPLQGRKYFDDTDVEAIQNREKNRQAALEEFQLSQSGQRSAGPESAPSGVANKPKHKRSKSSPTLDVLKAGDDVPLIHFIDPSRAKALKSHNSSMRANLSDGAMSVYGGAPRSASSNRSAPAAYAASDPANGFSNGARRNPPSPLIALNQYEPAPWYPGSLLRGPCAAPTAALSPTSALGPYPSTHYPYHHSGRMRGAPPAPRYGPFARPGYPPAASDSYAWMGPQLFPGMPPPPVGPAYAAGYSYPLSPTSPTSPRSRSGRDGGQGRTRSKSRDAGGKRSRSKASSSRQRDQSSDAKSTCNSPTSPKSPSSKHGKPRSSSRSSRTHKRELQRQKSLDAAYVQLAQTKQKGIATTSTEEDVDSDQGSLSEDSVSD
ncbi:hypothetical protein DFS34DRAFT_651896 [Phlyctochytrium arcticum]|nr:hypothetical protein DFS34DRAFT_651896 [Phlyctochytrium arcticum]